MISNAQEQFLEKLVTSHGSPGYEAKVQEVFRERLEDVVDDFSIDVMGSALATLKGSHKSQVLLDGHADEIGFIVKYIDDQGYIFVAPSGGWDSEIVIGQRGLVHTEKGSLPGVFGKKAIHLLTPEERKKKTELTSLWFDIGVQEGVNVRELVEVGDSITVDVPYTKLQGSLVMAKSMDNRTGIFVVAEALRVAKESGVQASITGVSAVQEEIGLRGAKTAAFGVDPTVALAIDVTHATDHPSVSKTKVGDIRLGGGPVIVRGPNINHKVFRRLVDLAKKHDIPYQLAGSGRGTGTDANTIQLTRSGVATGLLGIPLRYMHSPGEVVSLDDLHYTARLVGLFAASVTDSDDWIPEA